MFILKLLVDFSRFAFEWAIKNIVHPDTDQIVILNVFTSIHTILLLFTKVRPYAISPYATLGAMPIMDIGG